MTDYINRLNKIDRTLEEKAVKGRNLPRLIGAGAIALSSVVAIINVSAPDYNDYMDIRSTVIEYSDTKDRMYRAELPSIDKETLADIANGYNQAMFKDPFLPGEVFSVVYARVPATDPLIAQIRHRIKTNEENDSPDLKDEWGSLNKTLHMDNRHIFTNVDTAFSVIRYDGSQAHKAAQEIESVHSKPVDYALFEEFVLLHEIAHSHPADASERATDIAALIMQAQLHGPDAGNLDKLATNVEHVGTFRTLLRSSSSHATNGVHFAYQQYFAQFPSAAFQIPKDHIIPLAIAIDTILNQHNHNNKGPVSMDNTELKSAFHKAFAVAGSAAAQYELDNPAPQKASISMSM